MNTDSKMATKRVDRSNFQFGTPGAARIEEFAAMDMFY
jgi:hypothetical protein